MLTVLYLVFTAFLVVLTVQSVKLYKGNRSTYILILLAVICGLAYDNLIIAVGSMLGEGALLKNFNAGRFVIHALFTPAMSIFGFGILRKAGVTWAQGKTAHIVICVFTTILITLGVFTDVFRLDLHPRVLLDTLRYVNEGGMKGPPLPAILTIFFLIGAGISLWRKTGFKWLALGALFMFIAAGMGMGDMVYISNLGEVVLGFANIYTAKKYLSS